MSRQMPWSLEAIDPELLNQCPCPVFSSPLRIIPSAASPTASYRLHEACRESAATQLAAAWPGIVRSSTASSVVMPTRSAQWKRRRRWRMLTRNVANFLLRASLHLGI